MRKLFQKIAGLKHNISFTEKAIMYVQFLALILKMRYANRNGKIVKFDFSGISFSAFDYETAIYLLNEILLHEDYYFETDNAHPIIIDCGANIGISVLYFKKLYPNAKIIAFEPNPKTFKLLNENIKKNKFKDVLIFENALGAKNEDISFYISDTVGSFLSSKYKFRGGDKEIKVKAIELSSIINQYDYIDMLKMDIEGSEFEVIQEIAEKGLLHKVREVIVEYHYFSEIDKGKYDDFIKFFTNDNLFSFTCTNEVDRSVNFQNIILRFTKNLEKYSLSSRNVEVQANYNV